MFLVWEGQEGGRRGRGRLEAQRPLDTAMEEAILALEGNADETVTLTAPLALSDLGRFCLALRRCWRVQRLVLRGVHMRPAAAAEVMAALQGNDTIHFLDLSFNELGDAGIRTVLIAITLGSDSCSASGLHTLLLDSNGLDEHSAQVLALLGNAHPLRVVSLRCNRLADRAASLLAGALPGQCMLEEIDLQDNDVGPAGAEQLLAMINRGRGNLRTLNVRGNPRIQAALLEEIELKVSQQKSTPSPKKSASTRGHDQQVAIPSVDAGMVLHEIFDRVQDSLDAACAQVQTEARQMQVHTAALQELLKVDSTSPQQQGVHKSANPLLKDAVARAAASAHQMILLHANLSLEQTHIRSRIKLVSEKISVHESRVAWQKMSPGAKKTNERRLFLLEAELLSKQAKLENMERQLRVRAEDLDVRERDLVAQIEKQRNVTKLAVDLETREAQVRGAQASLHEHEKSQQRRASAAAQLQEKQQRNEEALRLKTVELTRLEQNLRAHSLQLAEAEHLLKIKIDQTADEQARARAKGMNAQAMMIKLEKMLAGLEGSDRSVTQAHGGNPGGVAQSDWGQQLIDRGRKMKEPEVALSKMHSALQESRRELQDSRHELTTRHAQVSARSLELDHLHAEVSARESLALEGLASLQHKAQGLRLREQSVAAQESVLAELQGQKAKVKMREEVLEQVLSGLEQETDEFLRKLPIHDAGLQIKRAANYGHSPQRSPESSTWMQRAENVKLSLGNIFASLDAEWRQLDASQQSFADQKEQLHQREERLRLGIAEHQKWLHDSQTEWQERERGMMEKVRQRSNQVQQREEAAGELERKADELQKQLQKFEVMCKYREKELQRREVELNTKEVNMLESETAMADLEQELLQTETFLARVQEEVVTMVKNVNLRHIEAGREAQRVIEAETGIENAQDREHDLQARERAVEVREREQEQKEKELQEVQLLAERYANALEIKKRQVAMNQLDVQLKLTEMGLEKNHESMMAP